MSILDDLIRYFGQVAFFALICSAIFWGIASGSLAINARSKNPLVHLVLGAMLHFIWFIVVAILAIVAVAKKKDDPKQAELAPTTIAPSTGFEDW
jgi:hypothetical protein